jgi:hypothetical protein
MIGIDTGRSRTISIGGSFAGQGQGSGTGIGLGGYNTNCSIFVGICVDGSDQDLRGGPRFTIVTGYPNYGTGWNTDGTIVYWEASLGDFTVDSGDAGSGTFGAGSDTDPWSVSVNGTFTATFEVEERLLVVNPNVIVDEATELENGYPKWGGAATFRGAPASAVEYVEVLPAGATVTLALAFASVSVSYSAVYDGPEVRFYRDHVLRVSCEGFAGVDSNVPSEFCSVTLSEDGVNTGTDWEHTYSGDGVLNTGNTDNGAYVSMSGNGPGSIIDGGGYNRADLYRTYEMPTKYRWSAKAYRYGAEMDQPLTWRFYEGLIHDQTFTGSHTRDVEQLRDHVFMFSGPFATMYNFISRDIETKGFCNARVTVPSLEAIDEQAGNWRCWIHGKVFDSFEITHDAELEIIDTTTAPWSAGANTTLATGVRFTTGSGGTGSATRAWGGLGLNLEGYRWLKLTVRSVGSVNQTFKVVIGPKTWNVTTGGDGTWVDRYIDLCCADNATWTVDTVTSRYPVDEPNRIPLATHLDAWGETYTPDIQITDLPVSTVIEMSSCKQVIRDYSRCSFVPTLNEEIERWDSPTDTTYGYTHAFLNTEGRNNDIVDQFRVVPDTGDPYYNHYTVSQYASLFEDLSGISITEETVFPDDHHTNALNSFFVEGAGYIAAGGTWSVRNAVDITSTTIRTQALWDWVKVYPGAGDVFGGVYQEYTPLNVHWSGRGRTQGIVYDEDNAPLVGSVVRSAPDLGSGTTDSSGVYTTGVPHPQSDETVSWFVEGGTLPPEPLPLKDGKTQRICFRESIETLTVGNISYDVSPGQTHYLAYCGTIEFSEAVPTIKLVINDNAFSMNKIVDTGIEADIVHITCNRATRTKTILMWYTIGGSVKKTRSNDEGANWAVATTLGSGTHVCGVAHEDGRVFSYWVDATSTPVVKVQIEDAQGNVLHGPATAISGVDDAGISADHSSLAGGKSRIILWAVVSGIVTKYTSTDGKNFT